MIKKSWFSQNNVNRMNLRDKVDGITNRAQTYLHHANHAYLLITCTQLAQMKALWHVIEDKISRESVPNSVLCP